MKYEKALWSPAFCVLSSKTERGFLGKEITNFHLLAYQFVYWYFLKLNFLLFFVGSLDFFLVFSSWSSNTYVIKVEPFGFLTYSGLF